MVAREAGEPRIRKDGPERLSVRVTVAHVQAALRLKAIVKLPVRFAMVG